MTVKGPEYVTIGEYDDGYLLYEILGIVGFVSGNNEYKVNSDPTKEYILDKLVKEFESKQVDGVISKRDIDEIIRKSDGYRFIRTSDLYSADFSRAQASLRFSAIACPKCKSRNVESSIKQIRSADEPATISVKCFNCPYRGTYSE